MDKTQVVQTLNNKGIPAYEEDGIIMVTDADGKMYEKMRKELRKMKYGDSYGWKRKNEESQH